MLRFHHLLIAIGATALIVLAIEMRGRLPWRSPLVLVPAVLLVLGLVIQARGSARR